MLKKWWGAKETPVEQVEEKKSAEQILEELKSQVRQMKSFLDTLQTQLHKDEKEKTDTHSRLSDLRDALKMAEKRAEVMNIDPNIILASKHEVEKLERKEHELIPRITANREIYNNRIGEYRLISQRMTEFEGKMTDYKSRLNSADTRSGLADLANSMDDYRREVFAKEALAELRTDLTDDGDPFMAEYKRLESNLH